VFRRRAGWVVGEWRAALELGRLVADPVYHGVGVPRGDGRAVVVLPGLFASDLYLQPLRTWLGRIGYRPLRSGLALNAGCPERLSRSVVIELDRQLGPEFDRLAVIGHSRGGILGWVIAARLQHRASHLVVLGSAISAALGAAFGGAEISPPPAAPGLATASAFARRILDPDCSFPQCGCAFPDDLRRALSSRTRVLAIRTRDDEVVRPDACVVAGARNVEVAGTHSGLPYNADVYRELAAFLAPPRLTSPHCGNQTGVRRPGARLP
jgi:pimeloyl-ACP methyl ester carboxylesterase